MSQIALLPSRHLLHCNKHFKILVKQKLSMFKIFVTVDKHQRFKSFISLNIRPAMLKIRLLVISKLLTISSNCELLTSANQHKYNVQLLINEQWCQYNWAYVYWTNRQWLTKPHRFRWVFFISIWWITVDMLVVSVVERYFRLGISTLTLLVLKKVNLLYINYCTNYIHSLLQHLVHS